jgi:hypothetical protein
LQVPFVAFQTLDWKLEIRQLEPKISWIVYKKNQPSDDCKDVWSPIEVKKQIDILNEIILCLLNEMYSQEKNERFVPGY